MVRDEKIVDMERVDIGITELPGRGEQIAFFEKLLEAVKAEHGSALRIFLRQCLISTEVTLRNRIFGAGSWLKIRVSVVRIPSSP